MLTGADQVQGGTGEGGRDSIPLNDMWHLSMATMAWTKVYNASKWEATYNSTDPSLVNPGFRSNSYVNVEKPPNLTHRS